MTKVDTWTVALSPKAKEDAINSSYKVSEKKIMNGIPGEDMPAVLHIDIGNRRRKFLKVPIQDSKREINLEKKYLYISVS